MNNSAPISFSWTTLGHEAVKKTCENALKNGKIPHALLFCGPSHIGKKSLATDFIQMVLCQSFHQDQGTRIVKLPCGQCTQCRFMERNSHPEVSVLTPDNKSGTISIEQARALKARLSLKSNYSRKKIILIHPVEALSLAAANALLKILEEPTPETHFFLLASHEDSILPTIRSRVPMFRLRPLRSETIDRALEQRGVPQPLRASITALSQGRIGMAFQWLTQPERIEHHQQWIDAMITHLRQFSPEQWTQLPAILPSKDRDPEENEQLLLTWFSLFRDLVLLNIPSSHLSLTHESHRDLLKPLAQHYSLNQLLNAFAKLAPLLRSQTLHQQPQLTIENILFSLTRPRSYV